MKILGVIPARFASTRFPGKALVDINGKTMIRRVYEQAFQATSLADLIVATDDKRIADEVESFGGKVIMTSSEHRNGTERCNEALELHTGQFDAVINIQGDEPFINPKQIDLLATCLNEHSASIATLFKPSTNVKDFQANQVVKVVVNNRMEALYFSRSAIPHTRENGGLVFNKHIGIYGYQAAALKQIVELLPSKLELIESLEQLRWLENGFTIALKETDVETVSIDVPEDLEKVLIQT